MAGSIKVHLPFDFSVCCRLQGAIGGQNGISGKLGLICSFKRIIAEFQNMNPEKISGIQFNAP
jgi:hypothetical protein